MFDTISKVFRGIFFQSDEFRHRAENGDSDVDGQMLDVTDNGEGRRTNVYNTRNFNRIVQKIVKSNLADWFDAIAVRSSRNIPLNLFDDKKNTFR